MLQAANHPVTLAFRHTLSVAAGFWAVCLVLTTLEAALGASLLLGGLFFVSIPMLVGGVTWATGCLPRGRGPGAVLLLGAVVLFSSSLIILLGLVASSSLLHLMQVGFGAA